MLPPVQRPHGVKWRGKTRKFIWKLRGDEILGKNKWNRWPSVYSYEERMRAVKLYTQYDKSFVAVRQELGYPSHRPRIICITQFKANTTAREYVQREDRRAKSRPPELHLSALIHACERFRLMPLCGGLFRVHSFLRPELIPGCKPAGETLRACCFREV